MEHSLENLERVKHQLFKSKDALYKAIIIDFCSLSRSSVARIELVTEELEKQVEELERLIVQEQVITRKDLKIGSKLLGTGKGEQYARSHKNFVYTVLDNTENGYEFSECPYVYTLEEVNIAFKKIVSD